MSGDELAPVSDGGPVARVIICDTSGKPSAPTKPPAPRFEHDETCGAHGFLSLKNARYLKRIGMCRCAVPMEDA